MGHGADTLVRAIVKDELLWGRSFDPYGAATHALAALCTALHVEGYGAPAVARWRPGALGLTRADVDERDEHEGARALCEVLDRDSSADEAMAYWVRVLVAYVGVLRAADRTY